MTFLYRIRDWEKHFEKAQTRTVSRVSWVPFPVKHDGLGFRRLMARENGLALLGAWTLIVQVAAKCPTRGVLADERGAIGPEDLALMTGGNAVIFGEALGTLSTPQIGWMECLPAELLADYQPAISTGQDRTLQDKTEGCGEVPAEPSPPPADPVVAVFPCRGNPKSWNLTESRVKGYEADYPGLNVRQEFRKAVRWVQEHPENVKTARGMPAFLTRWLNKACNFAPRRDSPPVPKDRPPVETFTPEDPAEADRRWRAEQARRGKPPDVVHRTAAALGRPP